MAQPKQPVCFLEEEEEGLEEVSPASYFPAWRPGANTSLVSASLRLSQILSLSSRPGPRQVSPLPGPQGRAPWTFLKASLLLGRNRSAQSPHLSLFSLSSSLPPSSGQHCSLPPCVYSLHFPSRLPPNFTSQDRRELCSVTSGQGGLGVPAGYSVLPSAGSGVNRQ